MSRMKCGTCRGMHGWGWGAAFAVCVLGMNLRADVMLVEEGTPRAVIVLAAEPTRSAQLAAAELREHVRLMTDTPLDILREGESVPEGLLPIYVGPSAATLRLGLAPGAFTNQQHLVRVTPEAVVLIGHDAPDRGPITYEQNGGWPGIDPSSPGFQVGSLYAVYDFLERECGVHWYMATDLGTVYTRGHSLVVPAADRRHTPWASLRRVGVGAGAWSKPGTWGQPDRMGYERNLQGAGAREGLLYTLRTRYNGSAFAPNAHGLHGYDRVYGQEHPDWFVDGRPGPDAQLRFWKDEVVGQVVENILQYFGMPPAERAALRADPRFAGGHGDVFAIGPNDNRAFGKDCVPPLDPARKRPGTFMDGIASEYWFTFVNRVARRVRERYPVVWISAPAYASHFEPPSFELEPNVGVCMANTEGWEPGSYGQENLEAWRRKVKRLFVYEYWYSKGRFPPVRTHAAAAYVERLRALGVQGVFMEMISNSNTAVVHLDYYVTMRMLRDESATVDALLDDYFSGFYGPAEAPMRRFWAVLEATYPKVENLHAGNRMLHWMAVSALGVMEPLDGELKTAEASATQEPYASRVRVMRRGIYGMMRERIALAEHTYGKRRRLPCPITAGEPVIDGELDDAAWGSAAVTAPFVSAANIPSAVATRAKIMRDATNLYLAVVCPEPFMDRLRSEGEKRDDARIRNDDRVHIALDVDRTRRRYHHLIVNPDGNTLDEIVIAERGTTWRTANQIVKGEQKAWDPILSAAAARQADGWTVELSIPLADLGSGGPLVGDAWGLEVARCRPHLDPADDEPALTLWAPTFTAEGFNFPDQFGVLVMRQALLGREPVIRLDFENDFLASRRVDDTAAGGHPSPAILADRHAAPWGQANVVPGFRGRAIALAGADSHQYVEVQPAEGVNLSTDDFTVALRCRMLEWSGVIMANTLSTSGRDHWWSLNAAAEALTCRFSEARTAGSSEEPAAGGLYSREAFDALKDGGWHQLVLAVDRGSQMRLYVDKRLLGQGDISMVKAPLRNALYLGTHYGSPRAELDELRVYPGAVDQADIDALHADGATLPPRP